MVVMVSAAEEDDEEEEPGNENDKAIPNSDACVTNGIVIMSTPISIDASNACGVVGLPTHILGKWRRESGSSGVDAGE